MLVKIIKENKDLISYFVYNNFNNALSSSQYPNGLKYADVTPVFKKDDKSDKSNYRPISILPNLYERIIQNHIYPYLNKNFSQYQCGFWKGFSAQHCLIAVIEKWRQSLDPGGQTAAVLTDLSKAFDYIDLTFIYSYLSERKQGTKINSSVKDVVGQRYYLVYPKVQSWDHVY